MKLRGLILFALLLGTLIPTVYADIISEAEFTVFDAKIDTVKGELTLSRLSYPDMKISNPSLQPLLSQVIEDRVELTYSNYKYRIYDTEKGIKWDIILDKKPTTDRWSLKVGNYYTWNFQPPLYEEFKQLPKGWMVNATHLFNEKGEVMAHRPIKIVGSYAVVDYSHLNGPIKFMHVDRPIVYDDAGNWIWGELSYSNSILTVIVDPTWLEEAQYPVTIDPVFGSESLGGSTLGIASYAVAMNGTTGVAGTAWYIMFGWAFNGADQHTTCALYTSSGGEPGAKIKETVEITKTQGGGSAWHNLSIPGGQDVTATTEYFIAATTEIGNIAYDAGTGKGRRDWGAYPNLLANWDAAGDTHYDYDFSLYCVYNVSGGGPTNYPRSASQGITVGNDADRWFQGFRGGAQAIGFTPDGERIYGAVRSPTQSITLGSEAERLLVMGRGASQALGFLWEAIGDTGITNFIRGATQTIHFASDATTGLINLLIYVVNTVGAALTGSTVAVWGPAGTLVGSGEVNATGYYIIPDVDLGNYTIQASKDAYQTKMGIYEVTVDQLITMSLHSIEEGIMFNIELLIFVALGCACLYVGYTTGELGNKIGAYFMSLIFWVSSMYQWIVSNPSSYGLILAFFAPFLWGFAQGMHALGAYVDQMGGKPRHLD